MAAPAKKMIEASVLYQVSSQLKRWEIDLNDPELIYFNEGSPEMIDATVIAERIVILLTLSFAAYNFQEADKLSDWLKTENLWQSLTNEEKAFFRNPSPTDEDKAQLSWKFECAYVLAWVLQKVKTLPSPDEECPEHFVKEFLENIPAIGSPVQEFIANAQSRPASEIYPEFLFYLYANEYFIDVYENDKSNTTAISERACFERLLAFDWIFSGLAHSDWDQPDEEEV